MRTKVGLTDPHGAHIMI